MIVTWTSLSGHGADKELVFQVNLQVVVGIIISASWPGTISV